MSMIKINKDITETFTYDVDIRGALTNKKQVRLVMELKHRSLLFNAEIVNDKAIFTIPKLLDVEEDSALVSLEVIADDVYFKAWEGTVELGFARSVELKNLEVKVEPVVIKLDRVMPEANEEVPEVIKEIVDEEVRKADNEDEAEDDKESQADDSEPAKKVSLIKHELNSTHTRFIKKSLGDYDELEKIEKTKLKKIIRSYEPTENILKWGTASFNDLNNFQAKLCMHLLEVSTTKKDK